MTEEPEDLVPLRMTVNGTDARAFAPVRRSLVDFLRYDLGLTGSHVGCEHGVCGACSVLVEGAVVRGCLMLAVQADGKTVETIEGATETGRLSRLQDAFYERAASQCGFCTAGMLLTAGELLRRNPHPTRDEIRTYISGNYCRCTGYQAIVDAIETASKTETP